MGTEDPQLLTWAERENRILVSLDCNSLGQHLSAHLDAGNHSPGVFILRGRLTTALVEQLVLLAYASDPDEWRDRLEFIPH